VPITVRFVHDKASNDRSFTVKFYCTSTLSCVETGFTATAAVLDDGEEKNRRICGDDSLFEDA
jgi:hypothetical protein